MNLEVLTKEGKDIFACSASLRIFILQGDSFGFADRSQISVDFDLFSEKEISKNLLANSRNK